MTRADSCLSCRKPVRSPARQAAIRSFLLSNVAARFYPRLFVFFHQIPLCVSCIERLPLLEGSLCQRCGQPAARKPTTLTPAPNPSAQPALPLCHDCIRFAPDDPLSANRSCLRYNQWGKEMIYLFKYRGDQRVADLLAGLLLLAYYRHYSGMSFQLVCCVPLHRHRLQQRGFNQSELLVRRFAHHTKLPVVPLLVRTKDTAKQSKQHSRRARLSGMEDAFCLQHDVLHALPPLLRSASRSCKTASAVPILTRILLIDDIFTTGATVRSCARTIRNHPLLEHAEVCSLTVFR